MMLLVDFKKGIIMNNISQTIELIVPNPWFALLSFLIAIISVITAVFLYYQGKKVKSPYYAIRSFNIVRNLVSKVESLEMLYNGQHIKNLTVTKIAFWNAGRDTINREDIPTTEPLIIRINEKCKILNAKIINIKNPANQLSVSTSEDQLSCNINFEYLDGGEGGVFQLVHTDINDENIEFHGLIKGAGSPIKKKVPFIIKTYNWKQKYLMIFVAIVLFVLPLFLIVMLIQNLEKMNNISVLISVVMFVTYWGLGFYLFKRRIPQGFESFGESFNNV